MNRYPLWKFAIMVVALLVGLVYTAPNFFGEAPAVQVSSGRATLKLDAELTWQEIGQVLEVSPNTAASRYRYALEKLRESLQTRESK